MHRLVETEIAILKALNHPHVLQLHEVYFEPSTTDSWRTRTCFLFVLFVRGLNTALLSLLFAAYRLNTHCFFAL